MPFTLAHPAAVVPLALVPQARPVLAALIIGSLTPDAGYFIWQLELAALAHTLPGTILVCLPAGLLLLAAWNLLRRPLIRTLPRPHRSLFRDPDGGSRPSLLSLVLAILLGAWSHVLWDAFTHQEGWMVVRFPVLQSVLLSVGNYHLTVHRLLQHGSSLAGFGLLLLLYVGALRRRGFSPFQFETRDLPHYALWLGLLTFPAAWSVGWNVLEEGIPPDQLLAPGIVFQTVVMYVATFFALVGLTGIAAGLKARMAFES